MYARIATVLLPLAVLASLPVWLGEGLTGKAFEDAFRAKMASFDTETMLAGARA